MDIVVSEWMGYSLFYEDMLPSVLAARDRWLRPGGQMLPSHATLWALPFSDEAAEARRPPPFSAAQRRPLRFAVVSPGAAGCLWV